MKKSMLTFIILAVFALSLTIVPGARATLVGITSTGNPTDDLTISSSQWIGKQFTTGGGGTNWNLASLQLTARYLQTGPTGFNVSLYSSTNGKPGTLITTLSGTTPTLGTYANFTYTAPANTSLIQNTTYWIVMSSPVLNSYSIQTAAGGTANNTYTGLTGWSYADGIAWSGSSGAGWTIYSGDRNPLLQVNLVGGGGGAVATPEPGTMMLLGSGVLTFGLSRFRRRKREVIA